MTQPSRPVLVGTRRILAVALRGVWLAGTTVGCGPAAGPAGKQLAAGGDSTPRWAEPACAAAERHGTPDPGSPGSDTVFVAAVGPGRPPFCVAATFPKGETVGAVGRTIAGVVRIYRPGNAAVWQSFELVESGPEPARLRDRDGDGWRDLEVLSFNGGPDVRYEYHPFDPKSGRFADDAIREEFNGP